MLSLALAIALSVSGIPLDTGVRQEFTNCSSSGSSAVTFAEGTYLFRVTDADVWLCFAASSATCTEAGERFPVGTVMLLTIPRDKKSVACRSSASTGDAIFTLAN